MKNKRLCLLLALLFVLLLGGCGNKISADKFVGDYITSIKKNDASGLSSLLEQGIEESNNQYTLQFPDELKECYLKFLQAAFNDVEFEINGAKKIDDERYSVQLTFKPLDIDGTTSDICTKYLPAITSSDLNAETTKLLEKATASVKDSPSYEKSTQMTLEVQKSGDGYFIADDQLLKLFSQSIQNIMAPYNSICEILDAQDYLKSCLDSVFKNDYAQFALHTGTDAATIQNDFESEQYTMPDNLDASYSDRYQAALKSIYNSCQYSVGIPKKVSGIFNYVIDIQITPNTSFQNMLQEFEAGTYYSEDELNRTFIEIMEKYADTPTYSNTITKTVSFNLNMLYSAGSAESEFSDLFSTILPMK